MKNLKFSLIIPLAPERDCPIKESIKRLNYPKSDFEIIVVKGKNPSENRNKGAKKAKYDYLTFLDDDAELDPNYLINANHFFQKYKDIDVVGGPQLTPKDDKLFAKMTGYLVGSFLATQRMSKRYKKGWLNLDADEVSLSSANLFVKKNSFKKIGDFDPSLFPGEDPEFFARAKSKSYKIAYSPKLLVYHKRRPTFYSFVKQFFKYGYVRNKKEKVSKGRFNPVWYAPSLFVIYLLLSPLFYFANRLFLLPLLCYLALIVLFTLYETIKNRDIRIIFFLPWLYPSIHIAYGLGMIWWVIKR